MAKRKTRGGGCLGMSIALLLVGILLAAGIVILLNLTPNQLGIADMKLVQQQSANSLGLADEKIKELIKKILELLTGQGS
jgi:hypothetical protein